ncbi:FTR1 family iron permease [Acidibrevibacterium fodinaquatile]|uniref:FTR1 family iron permease n=1 Tax=Acidibrevibacterium fodinaquatile TaxID=1969806 RepID=UPI000E0CF8B5|nr:FTR1 family protein [Acidibrevibacterium fodinaquatile]
MVAALLIVFREVIEAGLIVGIVMAATKGVPGRGRMVGLGIAAGVMGACLLAAGAGRLGALFAGSGQEVFQAAVLGIATLMLAWHTIWMASHGRAIAHEMRALGGAVREGSRPLVALGIVVAIAVLREGSEVVLFLYGIALSGGVSGWGMVVGGALGIVAGALVAALLYGGLIAIPVGRMLSLTGALITLMAAGMAAQAVAFLQQAGFADLLSAPVWNSAALLSDDSIAGRLAHSLVGYTAEPDGLQLLVYAATLATISGLARAVRSGMRPARAAAAE